MIHVAMAVVEAPERDLGLFRRGNHSRCGRV
jgi:hypothetical protein